MFSICVDWDGGFSRLVGRWPTRELAEAVLRGAGFVKHQDLKYWYLPNPKPGAPFGAQVVELPATPSNDGLSDDDTLFPVKE